MDRFTRIMALHRSLARRRTPVSVGTLKQEMECSASTVKRAVRELRYTVGAPVIAEPDGTGCHYDRMDRCHWQLPGLWFTANQLCALATIDRLLETLAPSLLGPLLAPMQIRIDELLGKTGTAGTDLARRLKVLPMAARSISEAVFGPVTTALLARKHLTFRYRNDAARRVSPQRLAHYRDNWYLDAWCHNRLALRTFALNRMSDVAPIDQPAEEIPDDQLDAHFATAYGIFAGLANKEAVLRFKGETAERVAEERWHPAQHSRWLPDGRHELRVPYRDHRELVMDVLRHGPDVEVAAPLALREEVHRRHREAATLYE